MFSSDSFVAVRKGLSAASLRQQAIANNIANVNTPGYKKQDVTFEDEFKHALEGKLDPKMRQTDPRHLPGGRDLSGVKIGIKSSAGTSLRYDGNNVDVDEEMASLAENGIRFNALAQLMGDRFNSLKNVIREGR